MIHWIRGKEQLTLYSPREVATNIPMIGLGLSVGGNITSELIVVKSFEELEKRKAEVRDKIVLLNPIFDNYSHMVEYRLSGSQKVSEYGGSAVLIRSITPKSIGSPHTGI